MFVSPAISLFHGLTGSFGREFKRKLLIVFITIYGSIITISGSNDGVVHLQNVYDHYVDLSFIDFFDEIFDIIFFIGNPYINDDLYIHFVSYLTGGVLGMPGLFFVVVSLVYAYFFAGSIFRLIELKKNFKYKWTVYAFITIFILWKNIEGINTVRTWTGLWVLFYACLSYYKTGQRKYLWLMFVPPLIHVGYFIMVIPALLVLILKVRHILFVVIFIASFTTTILNPQSMLMQLEKTEVGQSKIRGYYVEEQATYGEIEELYGQSAWYKRLYGVGFQNIGINILAFTIIFLGLYQFSMNSLESTLFSIGILTKALSNMTWFLTALNNRSGVIAGLFILGSVVLFLIRTNESRLKFERFKWFQFLLVISFFLFIPFVIYKIADLIYFISVYMLAFPFIPWFTDTMNYSIREFLGFII